LSIFTAGLDVAFVAFPALSETEAEAVRPVPSLEIVAFAGAEPARPERASAAVQWIVTLPLYQPAPFGLVVGAPERVGATLSILIGETVAEALRSALLTAVPVTDWLAALEETVVGPEQDLIPDIGSEQVKETVTSLLFQPLPFAAGLRAPVIVGADLSSFTVTEPFPTLPSRSVAVDVLVTPAVFEVCESVPGVGPDATPEPASVADQVIETLELFQPAAFGEGATTPVTTGAVLSRMYDAVWGDCDGPVQLLALKFGEAAAVTVCTPSPAPAVKVNVHDDLAVLDVCRLACAPVTSTHFVSDEVVTVSVSAPPLFA
jgi:hypothetical protein